MERSEPTAAAKAGLTRRVLVWLGAALPATVASSLGAGARAEGASKERVAYHVSEKERVPFVLSNIKNHFAGVGGPGSLDLVLVAHGPALKAVHALEGEAATIEALSGLQKQGLSFYACGNTLKAFGYAVGDFPEGTLIASEGGVVRLARLQQQGFSYLRP